MVHGSTPCMYAVITQALHSLLACTSINSGSKCVGGNSLFVALIDSESVAIATLWRLLTPTVGVNSLGLKLKYK